MKIGVFISRDRGMADEAIDIQTLAGAYGDAATVRTFDDFFDAADRQSLLDEIAKHKLEAVVLAGNSAKRYESYLSGGRFLQELEDAGININRIGFANIREQVAFCHKSDMEAATKKAKALVDVAIEQVSRCDLIETTGITPLRSVAVLGTTISGVLAAEQFLVAGFDVYVLERLDSVRDLGEYREEADLSLSFVQTHPRAKMLFSCFITDISGWCGDYCVELDSDSESHRLRVGGVVVAIGEDRNWTAMLQPLVQMDTDSTGIFRPKAPDSCSVRATEEGLVLIPHVESGPGSYARAVASTNAVILPLQTTLSAEEVRHRVVVTEVDEELCGGCGTCVNACAFSATSIDKEKRVSRIDPKHCKGCGNCVSSCPTGARDLVTYPNDYILRAIETLGKSEAGDGPKILAILCNGCGYGAADIAGVLCEHNPKKGYPPSILPLRIECGGRVASEHVLAAFDNGFVGVLIASCRANHCHNVIGHRDMAKRLTLVRTVLRARGIDPERLRIVEISPDEGDEFLFQVNGFVDGLSQMREVRRWFQG